MIKVNNRRVNIPSFLVKENCEIVLDLKSEKELKKVKDDMESADQHHVVPAWVKVDKEKLKGTIVRLPQRDDIQFQVNEQLIVELYSR